MHVRKRCTSDFPLFFWSLNSSLFPRDPFLWKCGHFGPWSGHPIRRARIQVLVSASVLWSVSDGQTRMDGTSWCLIISLLKSENLSISSWRMGLKIDFRCPHCPLVDSFTTMPELLSHQWVVLSVPIDLDQFFPTHPNENHLAESHLFCQKDKFLYTYNLALTRLHHLQKATVKSSKWHVTCHLFGTTSLLGGTSRMSSKTHHPTHDLGIPRLA